MHRLQSERFFTQLKNAKAKICMTVLLFAVSIFLCAPKSNFYVQAAKPPTPEHIASLAYYSIKGDWDSILTLNNSANDLLNAKVVLYSLDGKAQLLPEVSIPLHSNATIRLRELIGRLPESERFQEGSLEVHFNHVNSMAIAPQLTVTDAKHRLSFAMEAPMGFQSSTLEGVWWSLDEKTNGRVMLCNTTSQSLDAKLKVEWQRQVMPSVNVSLSPHQTLVLEIASLLRESGIVSKGIESGGLSITHHGAPGALIAFGMIQSQAQGFASSLNFVDTKTEPNATLDGTGVLLGQAVEGFGAGETGFFVPRLTLKNTSDFRQSAKVIVNYHCDGKLESEILPVQVLASREVRLVDFNRLLNRLGDKRVEHASIKITYSGEAGAIIGALASVDVRGGAAVDVPLVSRKPNSGKGGNHPFHIGDGVKSVAYLTNITAKPTRALVGVFHDGALYTPEMIDIAAGVTVAIDFLRLRDRQVKDILGRTLPMNLQSGQFFWTPRGAGALIGRIVMVDSLSGAVSNFSCVDCCQVEPFQLVATPDPVIGAPGGSQQMSVQEYDTFCGQYTLGPYNATNYVNYTSTVSSVMTVNSTGNVSFIATGETTITMSLVYYHSDLIGVETCGLIEDTITANCPGEVRPLITISATTATPSTIQVGGTDTTLAMASIAASPASSDGLQAGDFAVVEIIKQTSGGNFIYRIGASGSNTGQTQNVLLNLGDTVDAIFRVQAIATTPAKPYLFLIRVNDIRRPDPNNPNNSTSILTQVILMPTSGGGMPETVIVQ